MDFGPGPVVRCFLMKFGKLSSSDPPQRKKTVLDQFETPCQTEYDLCISVLS
jgi:hypothetical protein